MHIGINAWFLRQDTTGSGQYLCHLLRELVVVDESHRYTLLLSPAQPGHALLPDLPQERFKRVSLSSPFDGWHDNLAKLWFEQIAVPHAARRLDLNLLHVPYWGSPLRPTTPTVVTVHDIIPFLLPAYQGGILGRAYTRLVAAATRRADLILTDSVASKEDIVRHLDIPAYRVRPVLLAPDARFRPMADPTALAALRQKYGLPDRYLLYLGGFDQRKNVPTILQAFRQLLNHQAQARLVIAGRLPKEDSAFFPDPRRIVQELGLGEAVQLIGWVPDEEKPALYSGAAAFVFPSHYEGFGLPPLEAMACGIPAIGSVAASLPEVIGDGGLLVPPGDADALAEAMSRLWHDTELRATLGQRALAHAARFSWSKTAHETLQTYKEVISSP